MCVFTYRGTWSSFGAWLTSDPEVTERPSLSSGPGDPGGPDGAAATHWTDGSSGPLLHRTGGDGDGDGWLFLS